MEQSNETADAAPVCGNCKWGKPNVQDMSAVICYGSPPVPVLMGANPTVGRQVQYHIESIRPMLNRNEQGCSRFERGASTLLIGPGGTS